MAKPVRFLSDPDSPAGLAAALREIRKDAAAYLLRDKAFRASQNWRELRKDKADLALGGHSYFLRVAEEFDAFKPQALQKRKQRAAVAAIHEAYGALTELNLAGQASAGRIGWSFNWAPSAFDVMSARALNRLMGCSVRAFFRAADFMLVSVTAKAGGDARAPHLRKAGESAWEPQFLEEARLLCPQGKFTQPQLYDEVDARLRERGVVLPGFNKVQRKMTVWERAEPPPYQRSAPDGRRPYHWREH